MSYQLYWGDLHSHCSISYGYGTVDQALLRARQQLDFCTITGHAFWPDMPTDRARYGEIIDYHHEGFARLAANWETLVAKEAAAYEPGRFVVLPSYEWHSCKYGDHNVYSRGPELPLEDAPDLPALREVARRNDAILVPHHIGYAPGYRGIDWQHFDAERSPMVEIFSLHGCSESDEAPYPLLHDMGPRNASSTAEAGWAAGHRFGVIGSTDHHGGYPGSHGDGRVGVFANELTRDGLWEAVLARRVYAATGDRIDARLFVDDAWIGATIRAPGRRHLRVEVKGSDALDRVEVLKNGRVLRWLFCEPVDDDVRASTYRLRITWGWGRKDQPVEWQVCLALSEGRITDVESCFSGQAVVAPKGAGGHTEEADEQDLPHEIVRRDDKACDWRSVTTGNLSMRHRTTQAVSFEVEAPPDATVSVTANGSTYRHTLAELLAGASVHHLRGWLSEAMQIGPAVPIEACQLTAEFDDEPERDVDYYRLRVAQKNGQWAWLTPIWAER